MSTFVAADLAKFVLATLLSIVLLTFYRQYGRSYLGHWSWAWTALAVYFAGLGWAGQVSELVATDWRRILAASVYLVGGYLGVTWLGMGAWELRRGTDLSPRRWRTMSAVAVVVGLGAALGTLTAPPQVRLFWRVGLLVTLLGAAFLGLAAVMVLSGFARRSLGLTLATGLFTLFGVTQLHYASINALWVFGGREPPWYFPLLGIVDLLSLAMMGMGLLIWLFEEEWSRARESERAREISDARLKAAFSNAPFDFWVCDSEERYIYQNEAAIQRWGNHIGDHPTDLDVPSDLLVRWRANNLRALEGEVVHDESEIMYKGEVRTRYSILAPFRTNETIQGFVGIGLDTTERRRAEEEKRRLQERLRRSQKLESVGTLAGGIAHDFNNLLQVILGYVESTQAPQEEAREKAVLSIRRAASRAAELTRQLLAFSLRQRIEPAATDLNELISDLRDILRPLLTETIELDVIPAHELATVEVDRGQFEQVLVNLCINARDAMRDGGRLSIETENVLINGAYTRQHPWARPGRYVLVQVTDTGVGMGQETLDRVFEPFFTTKDQGEGTGLGLAMVYGIVKQHGGMIHVYSEIGIGTSVKMYFPVSERRADRVASIPEILVVGGNETILVAEDNAMVREMTQMILREAGYQVVLASDGQEALTLWREMSPKADLLLFDAVMPNLDGRRAFEAIYAEDPSVRALFTSGYSDGALPGWFIEAHKLAVMAKPIEPDALLRKVRTCLDEGASQIGA